MTEPTPETLMPQAGPEIRAIAELAEKIHADELIIFDAKEAQALREMAAVWIAFAVLGKVAKFLRETLVYIGWAAGTFIAWKLGAIEALRGALK